MKFPGLTSLYGRIFAIFWFTLFVVVVTIVLLFQLDPRTGQAIPEPHLKRLEYTAENINQKLNTPRNETVKKLQLEQKL